MNIERIVMFAVLAITVMSGVYLPANRTRPDIYAERSVKQKIDVVDDFDLKSVLDNTPFQQYYEPAKRNPFIPHRPPVAGKTDGDPNKVKPGDSKFKFPWRFKRPQKTEPPKTTPKVKVAHIPLKPEAPDAKPPEKIDQETVKKDDSIPVYLVGFAKTYIDTDPKRKAILANKATGEVYTVEEGGSLLNMTIDKITPSSIVIRMKNGRTVEFLHDVLKQTP